MTTNPADLVKPPVVVPRDDSHDKFVTTLKQAGYGVIHTALTRTVTLPDAERLTAPDLWQADWLVVTSKTTVGLLPTVAESQHQSSCGRRRYLCCAAHTWD